MLESITMWTTIVMQERKGRSSIFKGSIILVNDCTNRFPDEDFKKRVISKPYENWIPIDDF